MGAVFAMVNASPTGVGHTGADTSQVRAVIGTVTTTGPGSVRFSSRPRHQGPRVYRDGQRGQCPSDVPDRKPELSCYRGRFYWRGSCPESSLALLVLEHFLIHAYWPRVDLGFVLLPTGPPVVECGGGVIESPSPGVVRIDGILQNATIAALEARIRTLEQQILKTGRRKDLSGRGHRAGRRRPRHHGSDSLRLPNERRVRISRTTLDLVEVGCRAP
jgi:hypothetical protein